MIITSKSFIDVIRRGRYITLRLSLTALLGGVLAACTTLNLNVSNRLSLPMHTPIAVGPLANHSTTPLANRQVESMLTGLLQVKGFMNIKPYPHDKACAKLLYCPDETKSREQILRWARANKMAFVLTGATNEWRYKVGLDGEPVAGVSLILINVNTGKTIWTGVGSVIGTSRSGLDVVGQSLLNNLLKKIQPSY
ncbi:hypothetical protein [Legionella spiritensis]|uniref:Lipoprotein n=1 Tax=Legionella spiritensis TaxID=452 RepID=A0A0W0YXX4_LEGSP|nr:hypothetical protein [Legionella spiritensis]KTD61688.1 hypothetical protein Lspi_2318 [Legionella spiritensis]SNV38935.1 Uncharacterised protein [Legionella spiritensis]VEG90300.1 Uncharacterised protein [Legionella spiritensis]